MSIKAVCTGCGKAFNAPDQYAGKKVKCKACGAAFRVPGPAAADAPRTASAKPAAAAAAASSSTARATTRKTGPAAAPVATAEDEQGEYDLSGGGDDWSSLEAAAPAPSYNPSAVARAPAYNPSAAAAGASRGTVFPSTAQPMSARRNVVAAGQGMHPLMMVQIGAFALPVLLLVLGKIIPVMATPAILLATFIGMAFMFWGQIGILMTAAQEGGGTVILYLFIPLYPLYFILTHMDEVQHHLLRTIAGIALIVGGVMMILSQSPS
jgi:hypothetical protein